MLLRWKPNTVNPGVVIRMLFIEFEYNFFLFLHISSTNKVKSNRNQNLRSDRLRHLCQNKDVLLKYRTFQGRHSAQLGRKLCF